MRTEVQIGGIGPQMKGRQKPPGAGGGRKDVEPQSLQREHGPANTLMSAFWPPELGEGTFLLLSSSWLGLIGVAAPVN